MSDKKNSDTSLDRAVRRNALGAYAVKGLSMLVGLAAVPAYMRYFESSAVLGTWYTIQTMLQWVLMFDLGIGNGLRNKLVVALADGDDVAASEYIASSYKLMGGVCVVLAAILALLGGTLPWNTVLNISAEEVDPASLRACVTMVLCGVVLQLFLQLINGVLYALQMSSVVNALAFVSNSLILAFVCLVPGADDATNLFMLGAANVASMAIPPAVATVVIFRSGALGIKIDFRCFSWHRAKETLSTGLIILFLQVVWAVVASTHSVLISLFRDPSEVVEFQIYYKVYYSLASIAAIALVPIWSAVTLAQAEGRYGWVAKTYAKCLGLAGAVAVVCVLTAPFVQFGFDIWLGSESVAVNYAYVAVMSIFSVMFVLTNVNSSFSNGLSFFKVQAICMGGAAAAMVPLSYLFCSVTGSWVGVILAMVVSIAPFQIAGPISCMRYLKRCAAI